MEPYESKWADDSTHEFDLGKGPGLRPYSETESFELEKEMDVRGWEVLGSDGGKIGEVNDLIVDEKAEAIRYLDVEAVEELGREGVARHMLIPIGAASMHEKDDKVIINGISRAQLEKCPPFTGCPITRDFENELHASLGTDLGAGTGTPSPGTDYNYDDFYKHPIFNKDNFYKSGNKS